MTFKSFAIANLKSKDALVYFANSSNGLSIAQELITLTLDHATQTIGWLGYEPYNTLINKQLKQIVIEGENEIEKIKRQDRQSGFSSKELDWLGQQLFNRRLYKEAIAIFSLSLGKDSTSYQAHVGLGEVYLKSQQRKLAIHHLQQALALSAGNSKLEKKITLLEKPKLIMDAPLAQSYVGTYQSNIGMLTITQEGGVLFVELEGNSKEELLPETTDTFFSADALVELQFLKKEGISQIEITSGSHKFTAHKLELP